MLAAQVNRGELEGATYWHRMQGDVGPSGRADLVFVLKQVNAACAGARRMPNLPSSRFLNMHADGSKIIQNRAVCIQPIRLILSEGA
eukprot:6203296-Pleurochrysis_carterae.AAC.2